MKKEDIKSILLISLVFVSLLLTRKLWIRIPQDILPLFKNQQAHSSSCYVFSDMIVPHKYLLNFDEKEHTLFYADDQYKLWENSQEIMLDALTTKNFKSQKINNKKYEKYYGEKSIIFYFPEEISTYIFARALEVKKPNDIFEEIPKIDSIYIYLGKKEPFLVFNHGDTHLKVYDLETKNRKLRDLLIDIQFKKEYTYYYSMKQTLNSNNDIYIPYEMANKLPVVFVENELDIYNREQIRNMAEIFFNKDIDYLKEIVENNDSVIYIYNQRVLKIYSDGLLEYFYPIEESVRERNLYISLRTAADFISKHIGAPKGMYLAKIEEIRSEENLGYKLTFRYRIRGVPVILGNDEIGDFIQMEVFNNHVKTYRRFIRQDMEISNLKVEDNKDMLSAFEVIDINYDLIEHKYLHDIDKGTQNINYETLNEEIMAAIDDISLAYFDPCANKSDERLLGVWLITIQNRVFVFDVYTGELVYERVNTKGSMDGEY